MNSLINSCVLLIAIAVSFKSVQAQSANDTSTESGKALGVLHAGKVAIQVSDSAVRKVYLGKFLPKRTYTFDLGVKNNTEQRLHFDDLETFCGCLRQRGESLRFLESGEEKSLGFQLVVGETPGKKGQQIKITDLHEGKVKQIVVDVEYEIEDPVLFPNGSAIEIDPELQKSPFQITLKARYPFLRLNPDSISTGKTLLTVERMAELDNLITLHCRMKEGEKKLLPTSIEAISGTYHDTRLKRDFPFITHFSVNVAGARAIVPEKINLRNSERVFTGRAMVLGCPIEKIEKCIIGSGAVERDITACVELASLDSGRQLIKFTIPNLQPQIEDMDLTLTISDSHQRRFGPPRQSTDVLKLKVRVLE